jgi:hypothetical protein
MPSLRVWQKRLSEMKANQFSKQSPKALSHFSDPALREQKNEMANHITFFHKTTVVQA